MLRAFIQVDDLPGRLEIFYRLFCDRFEEKLYPTVPCGRIFLLRAQLAEGGSVLLSVFLEICRKIKYRARQKPPLEQKQRDQNSSDSAVPIHEGVDDLKLGVHRRELNQKIRPIRMVVFLPVV